MGNHVHKPKPKLKPNSKTIAASKSRNGATSKKPPVPPANTKTARATVNALAYGFPVGTDATPRPNVWPFGLDPAPIQGWLKAVLPTSVRKIDDFGNGYAMYHRCFDETTPPSLVQPDGRGYWTCSNPKHATIPYGCADIWEHRFRFGDLAGGGWCPPMRAVRVSAKKGGIPYEAVERYLPRPNPTVDGIKAATVMKHARINMSDDIREAVVRLNRQLRREQDYEATSRGRGRPKADIYDVAFAALLRVAEQFTYEQLNREVRLLHNMSDAEGSFVTAPFDHARVIEAMNGVKSKWYRHDDRKDSQVDLRLTTVLDKMRERLRAFFPNIVTVAFVDGFILSTAATDSARRRSFSKNSRSLRVEAHTVYDHRWGIILAWRMTWHNRGRGSAEAPQFPYLLKRTKEGFPRVSLIGGDGSYGSDRNHKIALCAGVQLVSLVRDERFADKTEYLSDLERLYVKSVNNLDSPQFRQFSPFRNRGEGHHETVRRITGRNLMSEPDRSHYPAMTAKEMKETPNAAEATLPEDQAERDQIIETEQFVGRACHNEMLCREIVTLLRALVKAQEWYKRRVDFAFPVPFEPRPEDEAYSIFRPRLSDDAA